MRALLSFALLAVFSISSFAQFSLDTTYGGTDDDLIRGGLVLPNGNILLSGFSLSSGSGDRDGYLIAVNEDGDSLWSNYYGSNGDWFWRTTLVDDSLVVAGVSTRGSRQVWLLKMDVDGNVSWEKNFGGNDVDEAKVAIATKDTGLIVVGYTQSFGQAGDNGWVVKTNAQGDSLWAKAYGSTGDEQFTDVALAYDKGFNFFGFTNSIGAGDFDFYMARTDSSGFPLLYKTWGGTGIDRGNFIEPLPSGDFLLLGTTTSFGAGGTDIYALRIKPNGDTVWTRTYGYAMDETITGVSATADGGFIFTGGTYSFGADQDVYLVRIDSMGNQLWDFHYGTSGNDRGFAVSQGSDQEFLIGGETNGKGNGGFDTYILKTAVCNASAAVDLGADQSFCQGDTITVDLDVSDPAIEAVSWSTGDNTSMITVTMAGTYSVLATDTFGCYYWDTMEVVVNANPAVMLGNDTIVACGESISVDAGAGYTSYLWGNGDTTQVRPVPNIGGSESIWVVVTDSNGCTGSDTILAECIGVGIAEQVINNLSIYPNPTNHRLQLNLSGNLQMQELSILDIQGTAVYRENTTGTQATLDVSTIPVGIYLIRVLTDEGVVSRRFVKQ